jgi:hypothetical protein
VPVGLSLTRFDEDELRKPMRADGGSSSSTGPATGQGLEALAIGALTFGDDPTAAGSPSASGRVVRIRGRR